MATSGVWELSLHFFAIRPDNKQQLWKRVRTPPLLGKDKDWAWESGGNGAYHEGGTNLHFARTNENWLIQRDISLGKWEAKSEGNASVGMAK